MVARTFAPLTAEGLGEGDATDAHSFLHGQMYHAWENVRAYNVFGDGTDETDGLQEAGEAAAAKSGILFIPPPEGTEYLFESLAFEDPLLIMGAGFNNAANVGFGNALWDSGGTGTLLRSTATSGAAITMGGADEQRYGLDRLMLIGPGSGTSIGLDLGSASIPVQGASFRDLHVANFATGYRLRFCIGCEFSHLTARGCSTGMKLSDTTNQNTFSQTEVQFSTAKGIDIAAGTAINTFRGGLIQNCLGTGINVEGLAHHVSGFYFENTGITRAVDFPLGGANANNTLSHAYMSTSDEDIRTEQFYTTIEHIRHGAGGYAIDIVYPNASYTQIINAVGGTITDGGVNTTRIDGARTILNSGDLSIAEAGYKLGFYGATTITKPAVTGSRGGNAALADLLTKLAALGLITDSSS